MTNTRSENAQDARLRILAMLNGGNCNPNARDFIPSYFEQEELLPLFVHVASSTRMPFSAAAIKMPLKIAGQGRVTILITLHS